MTIPTNGLDFYLPFDADMDEKIHSLTGTLSSSSAATYFMLSSDMEGKFLRCTKTQGNSSYYLKYPGSESLMQYGTGDFSASFWLRSPNWSNFTQVVFEKKYNDSYDGFVVYADGSEPVLDMRIRNQADHFTETYCNSSVFLHWCFVRVGTVGYWYCNGVLDSTTEGAVVNSVSNSEIFKIGYSASWPSKQAVFDLKALRIYNRALTNSEITELSKEFSATGGSLDTVLSALDGARDALVTAINAKGGSLAQDSTLYQCADAVGSLSGGGGEQQEPVLLSPTNVTEDTLASNTATNDYGTWSFSASNKADGYEPSALFMESYDNFTFGIEPTHWLRMDCTNAFAPESLYFYGGGSSVLGYTPKTLEIYGISSGVDYLLGTATLVSTDTDRNGLSNTVEATIALNHGGRTYNSIKILQTSNQTGTSVQAIWRKIEIRGYDHAVAAPCSAEYYKCASMDTEAKTWSGYKAVWGDNGYTISDDLTEGLVYSGMTPQVGTIYDSTCSVRVAALYSSLAVEPELPVFYAPLMTDTSIEINPSSMITGSGNVSFSTVDGVPTAVLDSGFLLWDKDSTLPNGNHEISISFGLRLTQTMENKLIFFYGSNDGYNGLGLQVNGTSITMSTKEGNNLIGDTQELQLDTWYHILVTYTTDGMWKLYINGTLKTSASKSLTLSSSYNFNFGNYIWSGSWRNLYACITRARIYDYAIDDTYNIAWLMQEIGVS